MKYKYYLSAIQCNRLYSNFIKSCGLGIEDVGVNIQISFNTDKEPIKENIDKIEKLLNSTKEEKSLSSYYRNVEVVRDSFDLPFGKFLKSKEEVKEYFKKECESDEI